MLTRIQTLIYQIPRPVRRFWLTYNVWIILTLSIIGMWLTNGSSLVSNYLSAASKIDQTTARPNTAGHNFGILIGYLTAVSVYHPLRTLCWLGVFWSVAALHYRYLFNRLTKVNWQKLVLYAVLILIWRDVAADLLTYWLRDGHQASYSLANGFLAVIILYSFWSYFRDVRKAQQTLTEQTTQAELAALKAQINPHFLFNSLNNIFGTALTEGGQRTPDGVQQLSRLMRYQLEKAQTERVDIDLEMGFLDEYVQFHRQLLPSADALTHHYDWDEQPVQISPLLLTPLVDYALQHRKPGNNVPIQSNLSVQKHLLHYQLTYPASDSTTLDSELHNVEQRLLKLYPDVYTLSKGTAAQTNTLSLIINLTH